MARLGMSVTERTIYPYICRVFSKYGWKCYTEVTIKGQQPDIILERNGTRIVSELKINSENKLFVDGPRAYGKALSLNTVNAMALLVPHDVRDMPMSELEFVYPTLHVSALALTQWLYDKLSMPLEQLASTLTTTYEQWETQKTTKVNYDLVVLTAQDAIKEIASHLRRHFAKGPILNSAIGVVGRFDLYKSLIEDFSGATERESRLYIADISAYILVNQLLYYQIITRKVGGKYESLPKINPITPPKDLLTNLERLFEEAKILHPQILGLNLFPMLRETKDELLLYVIARLVSVIQAMRPESIREDLFGRLYHETIPPETRKNLGAFYTKPYAARLLANLAIDNWDAKVLDPACGSGTLLVESYRRKAGLAPSMSEEELHQKLLQQIYGIDVMNFAYLTTVTNLTAQNLQVVVEPKVYSRDGIEAMLHHKEPNHVSHKPSKGTASITEWMETISGPGIPNDFDIVIMNPPFTRRERIPERERNKLERYIPEVTGKTGYWGYFIIAAERVLNTNGRLAIVMPEEFFVGSSARSVRQSLIDNEYKIRYIVRTSAEVAFSESAHYRDYLVVLDKGKSKNPLVVGILKKRLDEVWENLSEFAEKLKKFSTTTESETREEIFDAQKLFNGDDFVSKHIGNIKPLVGFNVLKTQTLALELLDAVEDSPTLNELEDNENIRIRVYNPGQYRERGSEAYARKLFLGYYDERSPSLVLLIDKYLSRHINVKLRRGKDSFHLLTSATKPALRSYSGVSHIDITDEEERVIVDVESVPPNIRRLAGLIPKEAAIRGQKDVSAAYDNLAGNFLLVRKVRLNSPKFHWLTFYSENETLGPTSSFLNMKVNDSVPRKALAIYLNSSLTLLQLIAFAAETEGAYVTLHGDQAWEQVHVPKLTKMDNALIKNASFLFDMIAKEDANPMWERIKTKDKLQVQVDKLALEMLGLEKWENRLGELYDAIQAELEAMSKIHAKTHSSKKNVDDEVDAVTLEDWLGDSKIDQS
jgi:type I restriction-modification system DNA methylase subunit